MKQTKVLINLDKAKEYLDLLVGKDVSISCGYGGVIFLEALDLVDQKIRGRKPKLYHGSYRLFCDEIWEFSFKGEKAIGRFDESNSSFDFDLRLAKLGNTKIEKIEVIGVFERTSFYLKNGCIFTIIRDDALDTFTLTLIPKSKKLTFWGDGAIECADYQVDPPWEWKPSSKRASKKVSISRDFLRDRCFEDYYPIAYEKAKKFADELIGQTINEVVVESGTMFVMEVGTDYRPMFPEDDRRREGDFMSSFYISVHELWAFKKTDIDLLDARTNAFHFGEQLQNEISGKQITGIDFEPQGKKLVIQIEGGYSLHLQDSKRYARWSISSRVTGFFLGSYRESGLVYRVSTPLHQYAKYETEDVHLSGMWQELDFYRQYFSK